ncbi:hypothetical protein RRG08_062564 [Elysia crispata]|uniref:Uncharacterized protein n=1 Tax=Elysia crispata TaxID=231223 RepID=A0AAE1AMK1_9GAST|nr:hypothetical protein RRG08_062564 [Elysia crispata]
MSSHSSTHVVLACPDNFRFCSQIVPAGGESQALLTPEHQKSINLAPLLETIIARMSLTLFDLVEANVSMIRTINSSVRLNMAGWDESKAVNATHNN